MFIGVVVVVAVVLLASIAAGPFRDSDPATRLRRRRRYLSRHEERATVADLELLLSDVLPRPLVRPLANRIRRDRLEPPALWHWASANGATSLALALCAGFDASDYAAVARDGFDAPSLRLHAELSGDGLGALVLATLDAVPAPRERAA